MTNDRSRSDRHLSADKFEEFLNHGIPIDYPIPGEPRIILFIDQARPAIGLRIPKKGSEPTPEIALEHVQVREIQAADGRRFEIAVTDRRLFLDAYPVLLAISDRVQLDGRSIDTALSDTIRILGRLLQRSDSLTIERELGLFGELLLFRGLIHRMGFDEVIGAWKGPDGEEHDFGLRGIEIEVKATNSERRVHVIGSLTQLVPISNRPLWLVSYQLTKAGPDDGSTLHQLIKNIRTTLGAGSLRDGFEQKLERIGWSDDFEITNRSRWRNREKPIAYSVTENFPRLTPALLDGAGIDLSYVPNVWYRVDLTHRPVGAEVPDFLVTALAEGGMA